MITPEKLDRIFIRLFVGWFVITVVGFMVILLITGCKTTTNPSPPLTAKLVPPIPVTTAAMSNDATSGFFRSAVLVPPQKPVVIAADWPVYMNYGDVFPTPYTGFFSASEDGTNWSVVQQFTVGYPITVRMTNPPSGVQMFFRAGSHL